MSRRTELEERAERLRQQAEELEARAAAVEPLEELLEALPSGSVVRFNRKFHSYDRTTYTYVAIKVGGNKWYPTHGSRQVGPWDSDGFVKWLTAEGATDVFVATEWSTPGEAMAQRAELNKKARVDSLLQQDDVLELFDTLAGNEPGTAAKLLREMSAGMDR